MQFYSDITKRLYSSVGELEQDEFKVRAQQLKINRDKRLRELGAAKAAMDEAVSHYNTLYDAYKRDYIDSCPAEITPSTKSCEVNFDRLFNL